MHFWEIRTNCHYYTFQTTKKKNRNLIKEKQSQTTVEEVNPISHLIQIQQAKKEKEPIYTLIEEKGAPRRREFVIEVNAGTMSATGSGPNKKTAKRIAAQSMILLNVFYFLRLLCNLYLPIIDLLVLMGVTPSAAISDDNTQREKPGKTDKTKSSMSKENKNKTNSESKQIVPGVLYVKKDTGGE